jgi:hypothetical protein
MLNTALPPAVRRWLCPAYKWLFRMGSAPGMAFGPVSQKAKGIAQNHSCALTAGQSHRLTSSGKAVNTKQQTLRQAYGLSVVALQRLSFA